MRRCLQLGRTPARRARGGARAHGGHRPALRFVVAKGCIDGSDAGASMANRAAPGSGPRADRPPYGRSGSPPLRRARRRHRGAPDHAAVVANDGQDRARALHAGGSGAAALLKSGRWAAPPPSRWSRRRLNVDRPLVSLRRRRGRADEARNWATYRAQAAVRTSSTSCSTTASTIPPAASRRPLPPSTSRRWALAAGYPARRTGCRRRRGPGAGRRRGARPRPGPHLVHNRDRARLHRTVSDARPCRLHDVAVRFKALLAGRRGRPRRRGPPEPRSRGGAVRVPIANALPVTRS